MSSLEVIYEDNHLLVINKPAGMATMGSESGVTVHRLAAQHLKQTYNKPGRAYVGIVSRLDAMTSGVMVLARTSKAAARLSAQFAGQADFQPQKLYLAAVEGDIDPDRGDLTDHVRKDDAAHRMRVVAESAGRASLARLRYITVGRTDDSTLLAIRLLTGRKHQIRVQLSDRGHPIVGDRKYGSRGRFSPGIALHSWLLRIQHPTKREEMSFEAPPPTSWKCFSRALPNANALHSQVHQYFCLGSDDSRE